MLDQLDRRFGRFAIPNITLYVIIGQVFVTLTAMMQLLDPSRLLLVPYIAIHGEPWRFVTFLLMPPPFGGQFGLVLLPFTWWLLFLMGNALESYWGVLRYNAFLLTGVALVIGVSFWTPTSPATNYYWMLVIGLAFAWLNPDFVFNLFFILPVKAKWIAVLTIVRVVYEFSVGSPSMRWQIAAAGGNFLLFFGRDVLTAIRYRRRTRVVQARRVAEEKNGAEPRHKCRICGKTDLTNPEMDFRYCSKCAGDECYCPEHIANHEHVVEESDEAKV